MSTAAATALPTRAELQDRVRRALDAVGARVELAEPGVHGQQASTPLTGEILFTVAETTTAQTAAAITEAAQAFSQWRRTPAPVRGQLVARLGELLRVHKADLADLVTIEAGKITSEALGEVQEMIDICDFAVGLSRQLYGRTIASERPGHRLMETWHPLGVVGVITAFNFPVAVWAWNSAVALVCGDTVVWKPSELTPLTAVACQALIERAAADVGAPAAVSRLRSARGFRQSVHRRREGCRANALYPRRSRMVWHRDCAARHWRCRGPDRGLDHRRRDGAQTRQAKGRLGHVENPRHSLP